MKPDFIATLYFGDSIFGASIASIHGITVSLFEIVLGVRANIAMSGIGVKDSCAPVES